MEQFAPTDPALSRCRRDTNLWLAAVVSVLSVLATLFARYPPGVSAMYPACPFYALTGLLCPGCGATRALAALLHGNILEALRFNPLFVAAFALTALWSAAAYTRAMLGATPAWPAITAFVPVAATSCALAFAIFRNLP